jgi:hypothetical protein
LFQQRARFAIVRVRGDEGQRRLARFVLAAGVACLAASANRMLRSAGQRSAARCSMRVASAERPSELSAIA